MIKKTANQGIKAKTAKKIIAILSAITLSASVTTPVLAADPFTALYGSNLLVQDAAAGYQINNHYLPAALLYASEIQTQQYLQQSAAIYAQQVKQAQEIQMAQLAAAQKAAADAAKAEAARAEAAKNEAAKANQSTASSTSSRTEESQGQSSQSSQSSSQSSESSQSGMRSFRVKIRGKNEYKTIQRPADTKVVIPEHDDHIFHHDASCGTIAEKMSHEENLSDVLDKGYRACTNCW